jgi:surface antigen
MMSVARTKMLVVSAALLSLSACDYGGKEGIGTIVGAGLGAWAGSAIEDRGAGGVIAVGAGTFLGGLIGNQIGRGLDKTDRLEAGRTQSSALETGRSGETRRWYNPDSGNGGDVTPKPAYQNARGQYCREYQQTITVAGKSEQAYGTACRQADGTWKVVS